MIDWKAHRVWLALIALAAIIGAAGTPLLGLSQQKVTQKLASLREADIKNDQALRQLEDDITATEKLKSQIKPSDVAKSLPPVDRLRIAEILEHRAAESHLTHFTYTLSPEEKTAIDTIGPGKQTLAADAPTDTEATQFIKSLRRSLPDA